MEASHSTAIKCPCCNNPWAAATGDFFAKLCQECETQNKEEEEHGKGKGGLSRTNMDFDVHPNFENFYLYANGNWLKNNPIPSGYPNWNTFFTLHMQSQERLKDILTDLAEQADATEEERKLANFYKAAMDEEAIEKAGVGRMQEVLDFL